MAELDQLNAATKRYVRRNVELVDNVFQSDPFVAYLRQNVREDYTGGNRIDEPFLYDGLIGGSYLKGKEFDITERQIEQNLQFEIKFFEVNVTLSKEDVQVLNKGENAIYRLIDTRMTAGYMTMGAHIAIAAYLEGQTANFTPNFNGLTEALNDGATAGWDGATFPTYGTITRGGAVGTTLNSQPTDVAGTIEYNTLEETYGDASFGSGKFEPNIGITTVLGYSFIKEKFQTQQRFINTQDPKISFNGMEFNAATLMKSRYVPGTAISGTNDPVAVTYLTEMSNGAVTAYPTVTAETLWWINARAPFIFFYVSNDEEYGFGFTGFKPAQGNTKVAGQVLAGVAFTVPGPRYHRQLFGITG
jgi:hypothetical protein